MKYTKEDMIKAWSANASGHVSDEAERWVAEEWLAKFDKGKEPICQNHNFEKVYRGSELQGFQCECGEWDNEI